ncbi:class I SAM-dependent methyltransferase [Teredinibacter sp. KSP-S5-2]|uniref:class I SAM-dependent methyltransferase n=1 Tax=Teredinibacter sp. KSP-S5-2 TaxID=3034506 RepID=UPI002934295D|nr:methyltransferase domain-containing protein [Teredinibacter sp. KSP-S5-2]WNO07712.1 methyltransferase domain-containing protein [Teredinibacter sp. KSP-S5-2]
MSDIPMNKYERSAFGLRILQNGHTDIRRLRRQTDSPKIHGNKVWKSSFLLMDYLNEFPPEAGCKILEVGCGWGLSGIYCAKQFQAQVTALDADSSVFPFLQHHAEINGVEVETWKCRYEKVRKQDLAEFDMVIGADICFWDSMVNPLYNLVRRAYQVGHVRVVLTDPGRPTFREMAERSVDNLEAVYENWAVPAPYNASGIVLDIPVEA